MLAVAEYIHSYQPKTQFIIPLAPTLTPEKLAQFSDSLTNPFVNKMGEVTAQLIDEDTPSLLTSGGIKVKIISEFPAHEYLAPASLALTTVGANTAELGSLAVPMLVLLPTQQLDAMRAWDGIPGILANLPGIGASFAKLINWWVLRKKRLFAWPNIWAGKEIVPELVGELQAEEVGKIAVNLLKNPEKLSLISNQLRQARGASGAAGKLAHLVIEELNQTKTDVRMASN